MCNAQLHNFPVWVIQFCDIPPAPGFCPDPLFYIRHRIHEPDLNCSVADGLTQSSADQPNTSNPNPTQSSTTNFAKPQVQD